MAVLPDKVPTAELQEGDRLIETLGFVLSGPPGTDDDGDGFVMVPLEHADEPVRFALEATWRVDRPTATA